MSAERCYIGLVGGIAARPPPLDCPSRQEAIHLSHLVSHRLLIPIAGPQPTSDCSGSASYVVFKSPLAQLRQSIRQSAH
ncbi:hypothetical protein HYQ46_007301 [Verticillium longisporum]|nr:hypothetical protein HYQ46_007301 [Verticillium longisporum]